MKWWFTLSGSLLVAEASCARWEVGGQGIERKRSGSEGQVPPQADRTITLYASHPAHGPSRGQHTPHHGQSPPQRLCTKTPVPAAGQEYQR